MITHFWVQIKKILAHYTISTQQNQCLFLMQRTETKAKPCRITNLFYTDRSGMNGTNNIIGAEMEACEDKKSEKYCQKRKKQCKTEKVAKVCKKTCGLCQDDCHDTLESLHCLSRG